MDTYNITIQTPEGEETIIQCEDDTYILDAADEAGIDLPYSCRVVPVLLVLVRLYLELSIKKNNLSWMMTKLKQDLLCYA